MVLDPAVDVPHPGPMLGDSPEGAGSPWLLDAESPPVDPPVDEPPAEAGA